MVTLAAEGPGAASRREARLGLYVHVPFCAVRCRFCAFSSGMLSAESVQRYLDALERETELRAPAARGLAFTSVFFGGGTPSALSARHFTRLWRAIRGAFDIAAAAEITLEANPETVKPALLEAWARAGVNRLSIGAQSFSEIELRLLGRIHDAERPGAALALARAHGFRRLSLDLMFGFPGHTEATWGASLDRALELEPEHLSAYCFISEAGTPLGDDVVGGKLGACAPDLQADLYDLLVERVESRGYRGYETSNFCRPDAECRHNLVYWLRRDYLALGPAAHGLWRGCRLANPFTLEDWSAPLLGGSDPICREDETSASRADEVVMLGLRLNRGLEPHDYPESLWSEVRARYDAAFRRALATGRLETTDGGLRIARQHRFVADDVIAWLMAAAEGGETRWSPMPSAALARPPETLGLRFTNPPG